MHFCYLLKFVQVVEAAELLGVEVEEIVIGEKQQQVLYRYKDQP